MGREATAEGDEARPIHALRSGGALVREPERRKVSRRLRGAAAGRSARPHGARGPRYGGRRERHRLQPRRLPARLRVHAARLRRADRCERQHAREPGVRRPRVHGGREGRSARDEGGASRDRRGDPHVAGAGCRTARQATWLLHRVDLPGAGSAALARGDAQALARPGRDPGQGRGEGRNAGLVGRLRRVAPGGERGSKAAAEAAPETAPRIGLGGRRASRPDREHDGARSSRSSTGPSGADRAAKKAERPRSLPERIPKSWWEALERLDKVFKGVPTEKKPATPKKKPPRRRSRSRSRSRTPAR